MKHEQHEIDSGGQEYHLPPVQLPRIPEDHKNKKKDILLNVEDRFKDRVIKVDESSIQSLEFLNDASLLAVGCGNGRIKIVSLAQGNVQFLLKGEDHSPVTGLACSYTGHQLRHALLATHSQGTLQYWHATSNQLLFSKKYDQMLQTCEISPEGTHYAFAGEIGKIRLGHMNKGDPVEVQAGHLGKHDNRVFCLKWNPEDNNMLLSGGWDKSVYFWDLRTKTSTHHIYGYYMGGEAIDFKKNQILLGNNKQQHQLRIYDIKADKIREIDWMPTNERQNHYTTGVLSCFFSKSTNNDVIACTAKNQIRLFRDYHLISEKILQQIPQEEDEQILKLYCMQHAPASNQVITGWSDGTLHCLQF